MFLHSQNQRFLKRLALAGVTLLLTVMGLAQNNKTLNASPDRNNEIKAGGTLKLRGHVEVVRAALDKLRANHSQFLYSMS